MKPGTTKNWNEQLGLQQIAQDKLEETIEQDRQALLTDELDSQQTTASFPKHDVERLAKSDMNFLAGIAMPDTYQFPFPPVLMAGWELLVTSAAKRGDFPQIALGIPRGFGKTTEIKLFILFLILFSDVKFILVACATEKHATNIIADVVDMLDEDNISGTFGNWRVGIERDTLDTKKFGYRGRNITLHGIGAGGSVRGTNIKNERPDVMIFDDVQSREDANSKIISDQLETWMFATAMKAKSPRGCLFIFAGNMFPTPYSILKKLKTNDTWVKFISGAILADGTSLWPELRSLKSLIQELDTDMAAGHPEIFFSEVLNDTEVGINTSTDLAQIKPWPWTELDQPQGKFILIDPGGGKKTSDETAIGYFEVYDGTPAFRKFISERLSPGNTVRRALLLAMQTGSRIIIVESTSYQYSLLYWFEQISSELNIEGIQFVDIYSGAYSKNSRISDMLATLTQGELILHQEVKSAVMHEIANWNPMKRDNKDNLLDILAYAPRCLEVYGAGMQTDIELHMQDGNSLGVVQNNHAF